MEYPYVRKYEKSLQQPCKIRGIGAGQLERSPTILKAEKFG